MDNPDEKDFAMAYRYGDRRQTTLFPQSIDEYIPQDAPVRAYDVLVDALAPKFMLVPTLATVGSAFARATKGGTG